MAKAKKKVNKSVEPIYPKCVETFRAIGDYEFNGYSFNNKEPSCFNGAVNIKKYKITIEIVDEPLEIYNERLEKLWVESDNYHHYRPLQCVAESIGYSFKGKFGSQRKITTYNK